MFINIELNSLIKLKDGKSLSCCQRAVCDLLILNVYYYTAMLIIFVLKIYKHGSHFKPSEVLHI